MVFFLPKAENYILELYMAFTILGLKAIHFTIFASQYSYFAYMLWVVFDLVMLIGISSMLLVVLIPPHFHSLIRRLISNQPLYLEQFDSYSLWSRLYATHYAHTMTNGYKPFGWKEVCFLKTHYYIWYFPFLLKYIFHSIFIFLLSRFFFSNIPKWDFSQTVINLLDVHNHNSIFIFTLAISSKIHISINLPIHFTNIIGSYQSSRYRWDGFKIDWFGKNSLFVY